MITDTRIPAAQALKVAIELVQQLQDCCTRIVIAGSLRRRKPYVGDVEILYVPRTIERPNPGNMFVPLTVDVAEERIEQMLQDGIIAKRPSVIGRFTWGGQNKLAIHTASGTPVDLFATTEKNWWVSLVVRTGSKETNLKLTMGAQKLNKSLNAYGCGVTNEDGTVTPAMSEQDVFELCGVPWMEPHQR